MLNLSRMSFQAVVFFVLSCIALQRGVENSIFCKGAYNKIKFQPLFRPVDEVFKNLPAGNGLQFMKQQILSYCFYFWNWKARPPNPSAPLLFLMLPIETKLVYLHTFCLLFFAVKKKQQNILSPFASSLHWEIGWVSLGHVDFWSFSQSWLYLTKSLIVLLQLSFLIAPCAALLSVVKICIWFQWHSQNMIIDGSPCTFRSSVMYTGIQIGTKMVSH